MKNRRNKLKNYKGFTLLEILLVIVAIGILSSIVLVAINPNRQLAQARNVIRQSDINTLYKAIKQYSIDNNGQIPNEITTDYRYICQQNIVNASCVNLDVLSPTYIFTIPKDVQSGSINTGYSIAKDPNTNNISIIANLSEQGANIAINSFNDGSGGLPILAANSCKSILDNGQSTGNGVYWIDLPILGPTQTYCLMETIWDGGGWMLALKATRGNTFGYYSDYWTTNNTLNVSDLNLSDGDAKFDTMNYYNAKDVLAIWPDMPNGGSISNSNRGWVWLQNNFYGGNRITLINFWNTVDRYFIGDAYLFSGWASNIFSSQVSVRFYGFNYRSLGTDTKARWGLGWNENSPVALFPSGDELSPDALGGIGLIYRGGNSRSAGDIFGCCGTAGINRTARVELYIR